MIDNIPADRDLPLEGTVVLDLSRYVSGPYCTMLLADAGADVIKIEPPGGEVSRTLEPMIEGADGAVQSGYFLRYNRHKRSITLDLKSVRGRQLLSDLIARADVLVENFRPGVMSSLGFDAAALEELNPALIYCSISGFGHTPGPQRDWAAYNIIAEVMAGAVAQSPLGDVAPTPLGIIAGDIFPASLALSGILMAMHRRHRTGRGSHVDIAMYDAMLSFNELAICTAAMLGHDVPRGRGEHPYYCPWGLFAVADGHIAIGVVTASHWDGLCRAIGADSLALDPRLRTGPCRREQYDAFIGPALLPWLLERGRDDAVRRLAEQGVPAAPYRSPLEAFAAAQQADRDMVIRMQTEDGTIVPAIGNPIRIRPWADPRPVHVPAPGAHTAAVLRELLERPDDDFPEPDGSGAAGSHVPPVPGAAP